ncbi:MAG TPA: hypothetical protein VGL72_06715 [Bryobacteraceae bacterium]|jgi:hypothetical protein
MDKSVLAAMAGVAAGGVMAFLLGSMLHSTYPAMPDLALAWVAVLSWVALAFGITYVLSPWRRRAATARVGVVAKLRPPMLDDEENQARQKRREEMKRESQILHSTFQEAKRLRMAELAADPARSKYVPLMERGDWWTDEQIAYNENPAATATCVHLQPVERGIRDGGIVPRLLTEPWNRGFSPLASVRADCRIDEPELRRRYTLAASVRHVTGYQPERSEFDNPWAELRCGNCNSHIGLVHPEWPGRATAWFPGLPTKD